jgi:cytochrome P450
MTVTDSDIDTEPAAVDVIARLLHPDNRADPYPILSWLREHDPVHRTPRGMYLISRHADALRVFQESGTTFLSPDREHLAAQFPEALQRPAMAMFANSFALSNPPEHTRLRKLVTREFTVRRIEGLRPRMEELCDSLLDGLAGRLRGGEPVDIQTAVCEPFAVTLLAELLGIPPEDRPWLSGLVGDVLSAYPGAPEEILERADRQTVAMDGYLSTLIAERARAPRDDMISAFAAPPDGGEERLAPGELVPTLWALWCAGFKTSAAGITSGVRAMLDHPGERRWLSGDQREVAAFVDEVLRYDAPTILTPFVRITARDTDLEGGTIPAGSDVRVMIGAANRDPAAFADPDRFDPSRDAGGSMTFTAGIHFCIGAALARTQMAVSLPRIHARFPNLVAGGDPVWGDIVFHHMAKHLPVALDGSA